VKGDKCESCGDYDRRGTGVVMVECCGRCNQLWPVGTCNWCNGTGFEVENPKTNIEMIKQACKDANGYLCGYDDHMRYK